MQALAEKVCLNKKENRKLLKSIESMWSDMSREWRSSGSESIIKFNVLHFPRSIYHEEASSLFSLHFSGFIECYAAGTRRANWTHKHKPAQFLRATKESS